MQDTVLRLIAKLEEQHNVECLFVVESGSRMWGFSSDVAGNLDKSSDYDVRGVFRYKTERYLGILPYDEQIENYEYTPSGVLYLDIVLWDIHKFAKLAANSNPSVYEWLQSNIIYKQDKLFTDKFKAIFMAGLCKVSLANHYLGMMIKNFNKYAKPEYVEVPYKKYLYMLRAVACYNALQQGVLPEMDYRQMLPYLSIEFQTIMLNMVDKKTAGENVAGPNLPQVATLYNEMYELRRSKSAITKFGALHDLNCLVVDTVRQ